MNIFPIWNEQTLTFLTIKTTARLLALVVKPVSQSLYDCTCIRVFALGMGLLCMFNYYSSVSLNLLHFLFWYVSKNLQHLLFWKMDPHSPLPSSTNLISSLICFTYFRCFVLCSSKQTKNKKKTQLC